MIRWISRIVLLWLLSLPALADTDFASLLKESSMEYRPVPGFHEIAIESDYVLPYEKRLKNAPGTLEVRFAIRPLKRIEIDYQDPHNSAPHPNDLFEMLFRTLSETLAGGTDVISRANTAAQSKQQFNAGWSSVGVFDVSPDVSKQYRQGLLIAMHHNDKADAYILCLANDLQAAKADIQQIRTSLRFTRFDKGINQPGGSK